MTTWHITETSKTLLLQPKVRERERCCDVLENQFGDLTPTDHEWFTVRSLKQ